MEKIILEMKNISKSFPGVKALDNVSFAVKAGTVHALMGENGAGKSTLMKCLFGINSLDGGEIFLDGKKVSFKNPKEAMQAGVAMVHQELNQMLKRNVMDNLWLGRFPMIGGIFVSERKMFDMTKRLFDDLGLEINPRAMVGDMSVSERQMLEIAKAVSFNAKVLVLDEPTSSLTEPEVKRLFSMVEKLKSRGCGIIYISHKMDEIFKISDEITIMRDGKYVLTDSAKNITMADIIKKMVGRELFNIYPEKTNKVGEVLLKCENLTAKNQPSIKDISFEIKKGEILGLAGLVGAKRTELLESMFGLSPLLKGKMFLEEKEIKNSSPSNAIKNGFALVTEERRKNGIFSVLSIKENTIICNLKNYKNRLGLLKDNNINEESFKMISSMKVKPLNLKTQIGKLSGGNQQKVIIGKWLLTKPHILLMDEPTRGVDVGAKYEIYKLIIELASEGKSIIIASSEMAELIGICDRILVMSNGKVAGEVEASNATQEEIMTLASKYV